MAGRHHAPRTVCPDCGSPDMTPPDDDGWQSCQACGSDFSRDYVPGDDPEGDRM